MAHLAAEVPPASLTSNGSATIWWDSLLRQQWGRLEAAIEAARPVRPPSSGRRAGRASAPWAGLRRQDARRAS
eukprot:3138499-Alexandrium_andersonii.AAC.1